MYQAPVDEIVFSLVTASSLRGADDWIPLLNVVDKDLLQAVLTEAGRFASKEIVALSSIGDRQGARMIGSTVSLPDGWAQLYKLWREGGWNGLTAPRTYGGQDLPYSLNLATFEMWNSASMAFAIGPTLTIGAVDALIAHGNEALKRTYVEKLATGEWTGTMNLTEPQAGSDLALLQARAEPKSDGTYRVFGQKIFITWGEHDAAENIIHLVLARLPNAPAGTRGLSLFLVPKFLPEHDGKIGARNDVFCHSIEHKLGIHGSPTCTMIFGDGRFGAEKGAVGFLVGEENNGLACMFTMMNNARLAVGIQGVAVAEAATQKAERFARERTQGKALRATEKAPAPIIAHPDIARMLLTMRALTNGSRMICYVCADAIDAAKTSDEDQTFWSDRAALLTPIAKAFATDVGTDVASMGIQVHGGMGYIEETGAAQLLRDARITQIYEGTNGVQAIDLVMRKITLRDGFVVRSLIEDLREIQKTFGGNASRASMRRLTDSIDALERSTLWLLEGHKASKLRDILAGATSYLRLCGLVLTGIYLAKCAADSAEGDQGRRKNLFEFTAQNLLFETDALADRIMFGAPSLATAHDTLL